MNGIEQDQYYMQLAIEEAQKASQKGEVPIGAVIVREGQVIARAHNLRETTQNAVTHAELLAIQEACTNIGSWRLEHTELYVTLEPCPMCAGAILQARIPRVIYGARDAKAGSVDSLYRLLNDERFNHQCEVKENVLADDCGQLLTQFFRAIREKKKNRKLL
ncbi:tRNA adenosine(34) deaminase TadA [Planococcus salinus]|uniref:tRNA-specific adenosine deaminase n=1 Tax=Planococcus salinus TaxID=1848460 RepID=A0A3M8P2X4_9BACL|nr:tRNA adenosine(34) deaminase TadA [Planococcus salinus]RNF38098.1 nucleoside deaminase [Planococcus salinus]